MIGVGDLFGDRGGFRRGTCETDVVVAAVAPELGRQQVLFASVISRTIGVTTSSTLHGRPELFKRGRRRDASGSPFLAFWRRPLVTHLSLRRSEYLLIASSVFIPRNRSGDRCAATAWRHRAHRWSPFTSSEGSVRWAVTPRRLPRVLRSGPSSCVAVAAMMLSASRLRRSSMSETSSFAGRQVRRRSAGRSLGMLAQGRDAERLVLLEQHLRPMAEVDEQPVELGVKGVGLADLSVRLLHVLDEVDDLAEHLVERCRRIVGRVRHSPSPVSE